MVSVLCTLLLKLAWKLGRHWLQVPQVCLKLAWKLGRHFEDMSFGRHCRDINQRWFTQMSRDIEKCHMTCLRHVWHVLCRDTFSEAGDILKNDITNIDWIQCAKIDPQIGYPLFSKWYIWRGERLCHSTRAEDALCQLVSLSSDWIHPPPINSRGISDFYYIPSPPNTNSPINVAW